MPFSFANRLGMTIIRLSFLMICLGILSGCALVGARSKLHLGDGYVIGCGCGEDMLAGFGDREFFDFEKSMLSKDANATLGRQAAWLARYPMVSVLVAGNADERGTETYNLALGQRRADAARNVLLAQGVAPSRIKTISYGKDCPVASGNDAVSYQQNRVAITSVLGWNPQNCR